MLRQCRTFFTSKYVNFIRAFISGANPAHYSWMEGEELLKFRKFLFFFFLSRAFQNFIEFAFSQFFLVFLGVGKREGEEEEWPNRQFITFLLFEKYKTYLLLVILQSIEIWGEGFQKFLFFLQRCGNFIRSYTFQLLGCEFFKFGQIVDARLLLRRRWLTTSTFFVRFGGFIVIRLTKYGYFMQRKLLKLKISKFF